MAEQEYEYAVMHPAWEQEPHRGPWPLEECLAWIQSAIDDGFKYNAFYVARRPVGEWERVE